MLRIVTPDQGDVLKRMMLVNLSTRSNMSRECKSGSSHMVGHISRDNYFLDPSLTAVLIR